MERDIFKSNKIKVVADEIEKLVNEEGYLGVLFPPYLPQYGIGEEYSVIGKSRCQTRIANILKEREIDGKKLLNSYYIFWNKTISKEEREQIEKEAMALARWYDLDD